MSCNEQKFLSSSIQKNIRFVFPDLLSAKLHILEHDKIFPSSLFDYLIRHYGLRNDRELASTLDISRSSISKMRNKKANFSNWLIIAIHEEFDLSIKHIKYLVALPNANSAGLQESDSDSFLNGKH